MSKDPSILAVALDSPILKLEQLHGKLIAVFDKLGVIRDTATTCVNTARYHNREDTEELATVLHNHVMLDIDDQMRKVTECIELLGGKTDYSAGMHGHGDDDDDDDDCDCDCHCDDDDAQE